MRTSSGILACHSPRVVAKSRSEMTRLGIWKLVPNPNSRTERIGKTSYAGVKWRHRNPSPRFSRIKQTILFHWKSYIYVFITNRGEGLISKIILFGTIKGQSVISSDQMFNGTDPLSPIGTQVSLISFFWWETIRNVIGALIIDQIPWWL